MRLSFLTEVTQEPYQKVRLNARALDPMEEDWIWGYISPSGDVYLPLGKAALYDGHDSLAYDILAPQEDASARAWGDDLLDAGWTRWNAMLDIGQVWFQGSNRAMLQRAALAWYRRTPEAIVDLWGEKASAKGPTRNLGLDWDSFFSDR